ncbi:alpha/beta hydrolase-fold protein [Microbacterium sp. NPDC076911]|uniref:alpha/beta hydrolase n=1 Tax=Microbacterium sp. NPDC076911 TaxID=3154958 RepID=UPI00342CF0F4
MPESLILDAEAVLWSAEPTTVDGQDLLVVLHGYGSDEHDLFALRGYFPPDLVVAALAAPLTPPWPAPGRSWYAIEGLNTRDAAGITAAAEAVLAWLDEHAQGAASIGLLGFSQGAAVSLQTLRLAPERIDYVVNLSGYVTPAALPKDEELAELKPPVFWGRGSHDEVIPAALVLHTTQWLPERAELSGRVYQDMAHSVSEAELADLRVFIDKQRERLAEQGS